MNKVRWGVLSTAKIAREKVIPALQKGVFCEVVAIASRNKENAQRTADSLEIPVAYGSYEELLSDPGIYAVYIPLPNHLHVQWAIKALEANKHVLCEKPIALNSKEALQLLKASKLRPHLKIMEAFMYRFHPQWIQAKKMVADGDIGELKAINSVFSYYNTDVNNIRNKKEAGGGGLMDIGCYCISLSRFLFNKEPKRVIGTIEYDPASETDRVASGILDFETGASTFTCSTQLIPYQRVNILGTEGRIELEIPFNAPPDTSVHIFHYTKNGYKATAFDPVDQYTIQGDLFSAAVINNTAVPTGLDDAVNNMRVIDAVFESSKRGRWKKL